MALDENPQVRDLGDILYLIEIFSDLKAKNYERLNNPDNYVLDENSLYFKYQEYKNQLEGVCPKWMLDMVETDLDEELGYGVDNCFMRRDILKKEYLAQLGIEYKTIQEFIPEIVDVI